MKSQSNTIFLGKVPLQNADVAIEGEIVTLLGQPFYRIRHFDKMPAFFMSLVSSSNHWLFIASTGGLTAGRIDANHALFPYYTVDKIIENNENTGNKAILLVADGLKLKLWEPFSKRYEGLYRVERNLYKSLIGNALVFEEINHDLRLIYRYAWRTSDAYGFVKTTWLTNDSDVSQQIEFVDGVQNILPAYVTSQAQGSLSVLLDAYKRSELDVETGLGIFALSSKLTDLAEPSESLKATTVWQIGLDHPQVLLSATQLDAFRTGYGVVQETDVRGARGAYFTQHSLTLEAGSTMNWHLVADVNQDHESIVRLINALSGMQKDLLERLELDLAANSESLHRLVAASDGLQISEDALNTTHHFANVLFNIMRGGIFENHYQVQAEDLRNFVAVRKPSLLEGESIFFAELPTQIAIRELYQRAKTNGNVDLIRLCYSYLPLTFSRRHGDPSRPWNRFSINLRKADGTQILDYEGNWRDIFQNWEGLAYSYPEYSVGMVCTFLNATTPDGYNPYRINRHGIDWEVPDPQAPWSNIGYWSDHQIIYLQKLMEICDNTDPGELEALLDQQVFSYGNVPYRIKRYEDLLQDPYDSITFDGAMDREIRHAETEKGYGTDARLVPSANGGVFHANLAEKLLNLLLVKLGNFVPEGGIWMNTQRPEWNDANNALAGRGLSVVTVCYLRRYVSFMHTLFNSSGLSAVFITQELHDLFDAIRQILTNHRTYLDNVLNAEQRRRVMDALGQATSNYRWNVYTSGFSGDLSSVSVSGIIEFLDLVLVFIDHTLHANKREDHLYHAYNILHLAPGQASVNHLYEMLEGQVAVLSSGFLTAEESLTLLQSLRQSKLYRADQHSYILYPNRDLPGFLEKNQISPHQLKHLGLVAALVEAGDQTLITSDLDGNYHFSGDIHNAKDVVRILDSLKKDPQFGALAESECDAVLELFENVFNHAAFTGRSGTFFAFEGLGSIYWHMVSKLLLATQETLLRAIDESVADDVVQGLMDTYVDIRNGLGYRKTPAVYGAFPTDPYSHTPLGRGAQQPGMTGVVKEEILTRMVELGLLVRQGTLVFDPFLVSASELLTAPTTFEYIDVHGQHQQFDLPAGSLAYTFCQVPISLHAADAAQIEVHFNDGTTRIISGNVLDAEHTRRIFQRDGSIVRLSVSCRMTPQVSNAM